jgi:tol-pal system protein YbgF
MNGSQARYTIVAIGILILLGAADASGQDLAPLLDRLNRLERDISTLNVRISGGKAPPMIAAKTVSGSVSNHAGTRLTARMDSLEQDLRALTGAQETINHQLQLLAKRLDKLIGDIDYRLGVIEGRLGAGGPTSAADATSPQAPQSSGLQISGAMTKAIAPAPVGAPAAAAVSNAPDAAALPGSLGTVSQKVIDQVQKTRGQTDVAEVTPAPKSIEAAEAVQAVPTPAPSPSPTAMLPSGTPKEQYTYAFNLLRQTNYDQAKIALEQFIAAHGSNPLAGNARYWLGETFYVRADYQKAAQLFFEGFQFDPKGTKAPDMLLKLGMSLVQLGKKNEACTTYDKVATDFAKSSSRIKTTLSRERQRADCPQ